MPLDQTREGFDLGGVVLDQREQPHARYHAGVVVQTQLIAELGQVTTTTDTGLTNGQTYCYVVTSLLDEDGDGAWDCESALSNVLCATPVSQVYSHASDLVTGSLQVSGKGKNAVVTFAEATSFTRGQTIAFRVTVVDVATGNPLPGATVALDVSGPTAVGLTSGPSDAQGVAEATWSTQEPNKQGNGGTPVGSYSASISDVIAGGYAWDGAALQATFVVQ
jgi:hypothetical protein